MKEPTTDPASGAGAVQGKAQGIAAGGEHDFTALPVGSRIGRYEITAILGQGGFGITYRARDEQLGREVAIKEYLPSALAVRHDGSTVLPRSTKVAEDFGWGRERFVSEGRTLASLHDAPAIVRVFDFMELNGTAYIVMELVRGDTLESRLKQKGKLAPDEVDAILWPLLDGLEQVHQTGFLHRDIKPANILMRPDGKPTLIDFGASRAAMAGRTTAMTAIFTPGYAAAEQFTSAKQGPWTDIYGLSATLYHAIAGAPPPSAFDRMLDDEYQPLARLSPAGFKPGLLVGLDAGLAVRAAERPQSIAGWRPLLAQVGGAAATGDATVALTRQPAPNVTIAVARSQPAAAPPAAPPAAAPAKSRIGLYAAAAAVVLLLLGGGYFVLGDKSSPKTVALQDMKVEELEKVLEQRRRAETEAAEKRRAEEEAKRQAEADAASKRAADDELAKAEAQRKKAEEELARLREELEAQRKAATEQRELADAQAKRIAAEEARRKVEAEMAALRAAEEEARRKAAIEAEAKRLADEALAKAQAERQKAEADAKDKAAAEEKSKKESDERTRKEAEARAKEQEKKEKAEAEVREKAEKEAKAKLEADKKSAEQAEMALKLAPTDRQRLQVALTSLGHNTGGSDGAFGPRSRQAIAGWQKSRQEPETGFLTAAQQQALLKDAAPAVAKFDEEQKKVEEEAKAKAAFDGSYGGALAAGGGVRPTTVQVTNGAGTGTFGHPRCGQHAFTFRIAASGEISGSGQRSTPDCTKVPATVSGRAANRQLQLVIAGSGANLTGTLTLGAAAPPMPAPPAAAAPTPPAPQMATVAPPPASGGATPYDGRWSGMASLASGAQFPVSADLRNGTGKGTWPNRRCGGDVNFTVTIQPDGSYTVVFQGYDGQCRQGTNRFTGTVQGNTLRFTFAGGQNTFTLSK